LQGLEFEATFKEKKRDLLIFKSPTLLKQTNHRKTRQKI